MSGWGADVSAREPITRALDRWRERVEAELDAWLPDATSVPE